MDTDSNKTNKEKDYSKKELTGKIIGACIEVSNELGVGFLESVYEKALLINYLKASGKHIGLLVNFGKTKLEWKRFVY